MIRRATLTASSLCRRPVARFARDEDGSLMLFGMCLFMLMLMLGGLAVDLMRYEQRRTALQQTIDRSVLAAASLTQDLDPEDVVNDYFEKAGLQQYLRNVTVTEGLNFRNVSATADAELDPFFTPIEVLDIQAGLYGVPPAARRSLELLRSVHLADKAHAYARSLSGGMKRRLLIAKAMVHTPPILVLDEPTAGVDVELRRLLWELVVDLNNQGVTIVLTTHYLEEAEQLCDRIAIINHGKLITDQPTRDLVGMMREKIVVLTLDRPITAAPQHEAFVKSTVSGERELRVTYNKDRINAGGVLALVQSLGYGIVDVSTDEADLEDVFVKLTSAPASTDG